MNKISSSNIYYSKQFTKHTSSEVERLIRKAKGMKYDEMIEVHGYLFCEDCNRSIGVRLDMSHEISVKKCKEMREVQLAWDVKNIKIRCRNCHMIFDGLK